MRLTTEQLDLFAREAISWRLVAKAEEAKGAPLNYAMAQQQYSAALTIEYTVLSVAKKLNVHFDVAVWRQRCNPDTNKEMAESVRQELRQIGMQV